MTFFDNTERVYSYSEAIEESLKYFNGDNLAAEVYVTKYALRNEKGEILECDPDHMHKRMAKEFARIESLYDNPMTYEEIYSLLSSWTIVPQGSPMSGIGNVHQVQSLSNCFVVEPPHDSYGGILKADQELAQIMKRRGGVGVDISRIRPKGLTTSNAARTTDGIAVFMERFSNTCREVAQGGRRGALMLTIDVAHPDIEQFIVIKKDLSKVTGANISIKLSDEFMEAVESNSEFTLRWPTDQKPCDAKIVKSVSAKYLWDMIVQAAWASAEPGLLFWDTYQRMTPGDIYADEGFKTVSTNPCAELGLPPYDSCRLILINLRKFVVNPFKEDAYFDFEAFNSASQKMQRLMDDLVDLEIELVDKIITKIKNDPEPESVKAVELELWEKIRQMALKGRRTGSGITALGDTLAALNIQYGSDESVDMSEKIYRELALGCWESSVDLASERGSFPIFSYEKEKEHPFVLRIMNELSEQKRSSWEKTGRRNVALTTTAPAGTVSILTQTTSGLEPVFMLAYMRRRKINPLDELSKVDFVDHMGDKWQEYTVYHHGLKEWAQETGNNIENYHLSPYYQSTANEINWPKKIDLQAAAQKWVCHSLSNTLNLPSDATLDVVNDVYFKGWRSGCKGVTIYRDGSRTGVLVSVNEKKEDSKGNSNVITYTDAPKRPKDLECDIHRVTVKGESYLVLVGLLNEKPYEVFAGLSEHVEVPKKCKRGKLIKNGKKDGVATYNLEIPVGDDTVIFNNIVEQFANPNYGSFSRTISLALRHGVPANYLAEQLKKDKFSDMTSFSSVIARVLSKSYIPDGTKTTLEKHCDECGGSNLSYQNGCITCMDCGYSKCG